MTDAVLPLGYHGALRIRVAPKIVLTPNVKDAQRVDQLKKPLILKGASQNLVGNVPCSLDWIATTDLLASTVLPDRRSFEAVRTSDGYAVREKGKPGLELDVYAVGLIGKGALGYKLRLEMLGAEEVVVPPEKANIAVDLPVDMMFERRELPEHLWAEDADLQKTKGRGRTRSGEKRAVQVGNLFALEPMIPGAFKGHTAKLVVREVSGDSPVKGTEQSHEWTIAEKTQPAQLWWAGMAAPDLGSPIAVSYGKHPCEGDTHRYVWELELSEPADPKSKRPRRTLKVPPQPAGDMPHPVLTSFKIATSWSKLEASGSFTGFDPKLSFQLELHLYAQVTPLALGTETPKPPPASPPRKIMIPWHDEVSTAFTRFGTVRDNAFHATLLSLHDLQHDGEKFPGAVFFAELAFEREWCDGGKEPVPFSQLTHYAADPGDDTGHVKGLAPLKNGTFSAYTTGTGVASGALDVKGHAAALERSKLETSWPEFGPAQNEFNAYILEYAAKYNLDPLLFKALIAAESSFTLVGNDQGFAGLTQVNEDWVKTIARDEKITADIGGTKKGPGGWWYDTEKDARFKADFSVHVGAFALRSFIDIIDKAIKKNGYVIAERDRKGLYLASYNIGAGTILPAAAEAADKSTKVVTWDAICGKGPDSPLGRSITARGFNLAVKYKESSEYAPKILAIYEGTYGKKGNKS